MSKQSLNVVVDFTREALAIEVDTSISGARVARALDRIAEERGAYPQTILNDNGYNSRAWRCLRAHRRRVYDCFVSRRVSRRRTRSSKALMGSFASA
jgi:transposase InsO family protein